MALVEFLDGHPHSRPFQIFGTDLADHTALAKVGLDVARLASTVLWPRPVGERTRTDAAPARRASTIV